MSKPFDHIATQYDATFTNSAIGQLQRKRVWNYVEKIIPELSGYEILELNCGTGEDAILFSEKGFNIVATDVSTEMLKATREKAQRFSMQQNISSHYLNLENIDETVFNKKFDLIFSNFGGLNCIDPIALRTLLQKIPSLLTPSGRFVAVIMPRFCLWETFYFLAKLQFGKAFRRWTSKEVVADLDGAKLKIWYHQPAQVKNESAVHFKIINALPIGLALPPSYLESFFVRKPRLLNFLNQVESVFSNSSIFSSLADHYIIDLKLK
jgi:ubiquinone/menaquinone biosynthesis C-methylase UbiE